MIRMFFQIGWIIGWIVFMCVVCLLGYWGITYAYTHVSLGVSDTAHNGIMGAAGVMWAVICIVALVLVGTGGFHFLEEFGKCPKEK